MPCAGRARVHFPLEHAHRPSVDLLPQHRIRYPETPERREGFPARNLPPAETALDVGFMSFGFGMRVTSLVWGRNVNHLRIKCFQSYIKYIYVPEVPLIFWV